MPPTSTRLEVTGGRLAGHLASRVDARCPHGSNRYFVLLGTDPADNVAAIALLRLYLTMHRSCGCDFGDPDRVDDGAAGRSH